MKKRNIRIPSFVFIIISLAAFGTVSFLYLFLSTKTKQLQANKDFPKTEELFEEKDYNFDDSFLTKSSKSKTIITEPVISNFDPYIGVFDAPIKVIVYSDFSCRYCRDQEIVIKKVLDKYSGKVRFIWKDYPELDIDSLSFKSSLGARCAQNQGLFWEFHDALFERTILSEENIYEIAGDLNLDEKEFKTCYENKKPLPLIMDNIEEANALGIIGVPNVFINDKEFIGSVSEEDFSLVIDNELKNE